MTGAIKAELQLVPGSGSAGGGGNNALADQDKRDMTSALRGINMSLKRPGSFFGGLAGAGALGKAGAVAGGSILAGLGLGTLFVEAVQNEEFREGLKNAISKPFEEIGVIEPFDDFKNTVSSLIDFFSNPPSQSNTGSSPFLQDFKNWWFTDPDAVTNPFRDVEESTMNIGANVQNIVNFLGIPPSQQGEFNKALLNTLQLQKEITGEMERQSRYVQTGGGRSPGSSISFSPEGDPTTTYRGKVYQTAALNNGRPTAIAIRVVG